MKLLFLLVLCAVLTLPVALAEDHSANHTTSFPTAAEGVAHKDFAMGSLSQGLTRNGGLGLNQRFLRVEGINFATSELAFARRSKPSWLGVESLETEWQVSASLGATYNKFGVGLAGSAAVERKSHRWIMATQWLLAQPTAEHSVVDHGKTHRETEKATILAGEPAGELCYRFTEWACAGVQAGALRIHGKWSASPGPGLKFSLGSHADLSIGYGRILGPEHGPKNELVVALRIRR